MTSYGTTWHTSLAFTLSAVTGLLGCSNSHVADGSPGSDAGAGGPPADGGAASDAASPPDGGSAGEDAGSPAPDGGAAPWRFCEDNEQCVLAVDGCCGSCGAPSLDLFDPINRELSEQHRDAVCDQEEPVACPECEAPPATHLGATCSEGLCQGFDLRTMELTACETDDQCRLRARTCCECPTTDFGAHNLIAIREGRNEDYIALVCSADTSCGRCAVQYPTEQFSAVCAPDGHCDVAFVPDSP
jgi:hypothetical protein